GDDHGPRQQDLHRAPGRQAPRRHDQNHHRAGTRGRSGSQRSAVAHQTARGAQTAAIARGRQGMTATRGLALILTVAAAGALVRASGPPAGTPTVRLKAISARVHGSGASLVIEASEPVAYSLTRPDPLTVLVDFRNVEHGDVANTVTAAAKSAIAKVTVEDADSLGTPTARVRIALAQPVAHKVRSDRNTVVVDFEKPSPKAPPFVAAPKAQISDAHGAGRDAMAALRESGAPAADPIAALGLDGARPPASVPAKPATPPTPAAAVTAPPAQHAAVSPSASQPPAPTAQPPQTTGATQPPPIGRDQPGRP